MRGAVKYPMNRRMSKQDNVVINLSPEALDAINSGEGSLAPFAEERAARRLRRDAAVAEAVDMGVREEWAAYLADAYGLGRLARLVSHVRAKLNGMGADLARQHRAEGLPLMTDEEAYGAAERYGAPGATGRGERAAFVEGYSDERTEAEKVEAYDRVSIDLGRILTWSEAVAETLAERGWSRDAGRRPV